MSPASTIQQLLGTQTRNWVVTGAAGFIGSNLVETLLKHDQRVIGLDNFATGFRRNLSDIEALVTTEQWRRFTFIEGDICDPADCRRACQGAGIVLHQAAIGSVPRSITDPATTHAANINGFLNMMLAARDAGVKRFVYASSSSVYGDDLQLPKVEGREGRVLSPYALTKKVDELYAEVFASTYGFASIGLRYFNVFGRRQDPNGAYAAVMPKWFAALLKGEPVFINGDGETSRDFCYIDNAVQANLRAALTGNAAAINRVYNVAVGQRTTLNELFQQIRALLAARDPSLAMSEPVYRDFRAGDVRHSLADISAARSLLGYAPTHDLASGLREAADWYVQFVGAGTAAS
ncbi:MAG TPA: SDR family oxidoreductase [Aestuariivirga sp.]|nr:SDR family oxidoreductase [Aestuariivirga sp.]